MRILFLITRLDSIGGAQVHVRDLAQGLSQRGHKVSVISGTAEEQAQGFLGEGIAGFQCAGLFREINPAKDVRSLGCLRDLLARCKPDLVSLHSTKAGALGRMACSKLDIPCLFTAHGWAFTEGVPAFRRAIYRWAEKFLESRAQRIVCVSETDRRLALSAGMNAQRLAVIHNGMPDVDSRWLAEPGQGSGLCRILMIARFFAQKDHETLLRALQRVPDVELDLIGDGPGQARVEAMCREYGLQGRVRFLGHRDSVAEDLSRAHVFCLISHWEGFPRSTLEAMRAGLPCVVSDVGGAGEAVVEGKTGFCVPRGNVDVVAEKLRLLAANPSLRAAMGQAGRARYLEAFTFDRMFEQTHALYGEVLK
jgi:glycosyltransferase involved in cell wall biosynthesis